MGLSLSRQSNFNGLKTNVSTLLESIESAGSNAGQAASNCSSSLAELPFGSWDDDISTTLKNYCLSVKAGMDEVANDISGGSFVSLKAAISDLITGLGQCEKFKNNYNYQSDRLRTVSNNEKRQRIKELVAAEGRNLDNCISYCNDIVNKIEAIQFNGIVTYTPGGGAAGLEDTEALYEASLIDTSAIDAMKEELDNKQINAWFGLNNSEKGGSGWSCVKLLDGKYQVMSRPGETYKIYDSAEDMIADGFTIAEDHRFSINSSNSQSAAATNTTPSTEGNLRDRGYDNSANQGAQPSLLALYKPTEEQVAAMKTECDQKPINAWFGLDNKASGQTGWSAIKLSNGKYQVMSDPQHQYKQYNSVEEMAADGFTVAEDHRFSAPQSKSTTPAPSATATPAPESTPAPETSKPKSTPITEDFVRSIDSKGKVVYDSNGKKYTVYNDGDMYLTLVDSSGQISSVTALDMFSSKDFFTHD